MVGALERGLKRQNASVGLLWELTSLLAAGATLDPIPPER